MERFEVPGQYRWVSSNRLIVSNARDFGDRE